MPSAYCPICSGAKTLVMKTGKEAELELWNRFDKTYFGDKFQLIFDVSTIMLTYCQSCDHFFYSNEVSKQQLAAMYVAHAEHKQNRVTSNDTKSTTFQSCMLGAIASLKQPSNCNLLDYGAGSGTWSDIADELGFNVVSYEPHTKRTIKKKYCQTDDWKEVADNKYDVVICNQVLEHLNDPVACLREMRTVCKNRAVLFSSTPNINKVKKQSLVETWPWDGKQMHLMAPMQHLQGFSQNSLITAHKSAGFEIDTRDFIRNSHFWKIGFAYMISTLVNQVTRTGFIFRAVDC